ncbi:uncharacterized protein E0L32_006868 [Thyridium curvatum]|uniref:DUF221-domain-containing protein n=1 Tax=Thyridium curvatum TaxID=1093900 RepID=A0A507B055_9PEZI|nr:uncharacterized protein E0L32_006868 [Thyridium curvatum]TPX12456.1 hypothetical protein E0L32_006868 [Thyridium curvatum]
MESIVRAILTLVPRDGNPPPETSDDPGKQLLSLLSNPFGGQLQIGSIWASIGTSFGITAGIALLFSLVRPYNTIVYAPKLKHADELHAPPALGKGMFAWIGPLWKTNEKDIVRLVGMDAAIFLRFTKMYRNMFVIMAILGCAVLIPVNYTKAFRYGDPVWLLLLTPMNVLGQPNWVQVVLIWLYTIIVAGFLWWNYRKLFDIPKKLSSDEGIARIIDEVAPNSSFSRTAVARNVKILPELISEHEKAVRKLEKVLAKYLKDPHNLPASRPVCAPSKKDRSYGTYPKGQKVDAIDYLTQRIKELEIEIKEVRASVDKRNTMPYGFASYSDISEAHAIAYAARKKKPHNATIRLAPRPNDIIWDNMPLSAPTRSRRRFINNTWIALLTVLWVAPNAMIAIFLVNLSNLGLLWPAFQRSLAGNTSFWQIVQGVLSPAITSTIYLVLPIIFRRLSIQAGDQTKTGRERHVMAKLYSFFVFNNLVVFSLFNSVFTFVSNVVKSTEGGTDAWQAMLKAQPGKLLIGSLCTMSPFWITWLMQRQMGVAIDLAQLWPLFWGFLMRKFSSPTPRELIELTAPPPFDYASYYNYFVYYATVALCYSGVQPLVLPAVAIYFAIDVVLRKYMLLYVFVTKTESGGMFWRVLFNRMIFASMLAHVVVFLIVFVQGTEDHLQAYCVAPLPFLMVGFKLYCSKAFDDKIHYYATQNLHQPHAEGKEQSLRSDRLAARFGHPALYKPLTTPMVHAKAQNILASVYSGRLTHGREAGSGDTMSVSGYSDTYVLDPMNAGKPGKRVAPSGASMPGFEVVPESRLDFEYYKNRDEFGEDHGGGDIFGTPRDLIRPGTPGSLFGGAGSDSRPGTPVGGMTGRRQYSVQMLNSAGGTTYNPGYHNPSSPSPPPGVGVGGGFPAHSPYSHEGGATPRAGSPSYGLGDVPTRTRSPFYGVAGGNESGSNLVHNAAGMPMSPAAQPTIPALASPRSREASLDRGVGVGGSGGGNPRAPGMLGGGPYGYGNLPQEEEDPDPMSYDYFRGARPSRRRDTSEQHRWGG